MKLRVLSKRQVRRMHESLTQEDVEYIETVGAGLNATKISTIFFNTNTPDSTIKRFFRSQDKYKVVDIIRTPRSRRAKVRYSQPDYRKIVKALKCAYRLKSLL